MVRGRTGGFHLALSPDRISIGDVVRRTQSSMVIVECFDRRTNGCPLARACGLKGVLSEAVDAFLAVLDRYSIADMVANPRWVSRLIQLLPAEAAPAAARRTT